MRAIADFSKKAAKSAGQLIKNRHNEQEKNLNNEKVQPSYAQILILGDESAGKRSLLNKYQNPQSEFEDFRLQTTAINGKIIDSGQRTIPLSISNVSGSEDFEYIRHSFYPRATAIMLCFALNDKNKLLNILDKWIPEIHQRAPNTPIILVGTKIDLRNDNQVQNQTLINKEYGQQLAKEIGAVTYVECSAKTGRGVENAFGRAIRASGINIPALNIPMVTPEIAKAYTNGAVLGLLATKKIHTDVASFFTPRLNIQDGIILSMVNKATYKLANESAPSFCEKEIARQQNAQTENVKSK